MLTDAEYREIIQNRNTLQGRMDAHLAEYDKLGVLREKVKESGLALKDQMDLYTNFLKDAIEEYEEAHPPEGA